MDPIDKRILTFMEDNKVATVCFNTEMNEPYCINCFYCFIQESNVLVFKSSRGTAHDAYIRQSNPSAGTIIADQVDVTKLKGVQFTGKLLEEQSIHGSGFGFSYLKRFPLSIAIPGYLWGIQLEYLKYTDNTLGFGNKIIWKK